MAVPTITGVSPAAGPAGGGALVQISGTGFRLYTPPAYGPVQGPAPCYVQVLFGTAASPRVFVLDGTLLEAYSPAYPGDVELATFAPFGITVRNLDDALVPIPGESATLASAYTFTREDLRPPTLELESPATRITRALLQILKREVLLATSPRTHVDYSPDGIDLNQAEVPSVHLIGPEFIPDAYGWENESIPETQGDGSALVWPNPIMHTLRYTVYGHSNAQPEFITLMSAIRKVVWRNPYLVISGDVPAGARLRLPIVMTDEPSPGAGVLNASLNSMAAKLEIRRVPILYLPPYMRAWPVERLRLEVQKLNGTLVEPITLW